MGGKLLRLPLLRLLLQEMYVVLEIADSDFKKLFRAPVYLTELHIKTLLYNLLVGVKYVHSAGILHRDLVSIFLHCFF